MLMAKIIKFINPANFKKLIGSSKHVHLIDLQKEKDFTKRHIKGSIGTFAYLVKSDADKSKLDPVVEKVKKDNLDIIICPRDGNAAKNAYDYFLSKGVAEERLYIL
jgi:rhodanese-related sulfurtransferase